MIIDCISDPHGFYPKLKGGDLLLIAGDLTANDTQKEFDKFFQWLDKQSYKKKIFIAGNHDNLLENFTKGIGETSGMFHTDNEKVYLCDSGIEFEGLKIWGSPWIKTFIDINPDYSAFTCDTDKELGKKWELIPRDIDILVTHCPPYGILDEVIYVEEGKEKREHAGSISLAWNSVSKIHVKLHVFGHIHEGYGRDNRIINCVNASIMNELYEP